jgi:hypothetical protein
VFAARALLTLRVWLGVAATAVAFATIVSAAPAEAQTVTVSLSPTLADTVAAVADLTGASRTFYHTLSVSLTGCDKTDGGTKTCRVYMSASPASSSLVSSLSWGTTQADCTNTVQSGTTPTTTRAAAAILSKTESPKFPKASATIYLCYTATLSWSVAPQRFAPNFYFTVIRQ